MAVKIKLKRMGKIHAPYYRIVVADARTKRDGRAIEEIGKYHPMSEPSFIEVSSERAQYWLSVGAQPTDPVRRLFEITGDWQKFRGEAGAEGTLRTPAPKTARSERFAEATGQAKTGTETAPKGRTKKADTEAKPDKADVAAKPDKTDGAARRKPRTARADAAVKEADEAAAKPDKTADKTADQAAGKADKTEAKAAGKTEAKAAGKTEDKPGKTEDKADKPARKAADKAAGKPDKAVGRAAGKQAKSEKPAAEAPPPEAAETSQADAADEAPQAKVADEAPQTEVADEAPQAEVADEAPQAEAAGSGSGG